jgi:hypothetical protein
MRLPIYLASPAVALLLLAGCNGEKKKAEDQRTAVGQILPASVSDSMLPYDTLRSQPPLAPQTEGGAAKSKARDESGADRARSTTAQPSVAASSAPAVELTAPATVPEAE